MKVGVEVIAAGRHPREFPAQAAFEGLDSGYGRPGHRGEGYIAGREMGKGAVKMIGHEGATRAAFLPFRPKHEMVNEQLAATGKKIVQRNCAARGVKDIVFADLLPGQIPPFGSEQILETDDFLFLGQQRLAGGEPFFG